MLCVIAACVTLKHLHIRMLYTPVQFRRADLLSLRSLARLETLRITHGVGSSNIHHFHSRDVVDTVTACHLLKHLEIDIEALVLYTDQLIEIGTALPNLEFLGSNIIMDVEWFRDRPTAPVFPSLRHIRVSAITVPEVSAMEELFARPDYDQINDGYAWGFYLARISALMVSHILRQMPLLRFFRISASITPAEVLRDLEFEEGIYDRWAFSFSEMVEEEAVRRHNPGNK